LLYPDNLAMIM